MENIIKASQKTKIELPYDPAGPLLDIYLKKQKCSFDGWKRCFSREDIQMTNKHMKRCSTLLIIREMQIKTTMSYHLTLFRMVIIKIKNLQTINAREDVEKRGTLLNCW